jgi:hypothetical protein
MKRLLGLTLAATTALSVASAARAEPEHVRGTVSAISPDALTVHTATGGNVLVLLSGDTKYVKAVRSDLDHVTVGNYIGTVTKNVGNNLVALSVVIFPPSLKGANEGHFGWDKVPDTTLSDGPRTSSAMTNGSVATIGGSESAARVDSAMTNGSVAITTAKGGGRQLMLTYHGGEQTILVPPTAPIVAFQPDTMSELKPGATVFVVANKNDGKATAGLIAVSSDGVKPPL